MHWDPQHKDRRTNLIVPKSEELLKPRVINPKIMQQKLTYNKLKQKYYYDIHTQSLFQDFRLVMMFYANKW